jgi:hypothetical protein
MKYLKRFKKFETIGYTEMTDELWNDMSDILLELSDQGFLVSKDVDDIKKVDNKLCEDVIEIIIDHNQNFFSFEKIEEPVRRLIDYMVSLKWNYSLMCFNKYSYATFECGGEHPLAKIEKSFSNKFERDLHKSVINRISKESAAYKIVFYQNIDHIIKENLSSQDLTLDVKDIFLELGDQGYEVDIDMRPQGVDMFSVSVSNDRLFSWNEVKEQFMRSMDIIISTDIRPGFILDKTIITVQGSHGMETQKIAGCALSWFLNLARESGNKIYEVTFIYNTPRYVV